MNIELLTPLVNITIFVFLICCNIGLICCLISFLIYLFGGSDENPKCR